MASLDDPDKVLTWRGPQGFTSMCRMDFREGGTTLVSMRSEQGWELVNTWRIARSSRERIDFVQDFADGEGKPLSPADVRLPPAIPEEVRHIRTFSAVDDATTELTVHEFGYPNEQVIEVSRSAWSRSSTNWRRCSRRDDR